MRLDRVQELERLGLGLAQVVDGLRRRLPFAIFSPEPVEAGVFFDDKYLLRRDRRHGTLGLARLHCGK